MKNEDFGIVELMWIRRERRRKGVRSIEGVPPLIFISTESTLKNYRIYGNTVNGESVGDLVESGEHAGEYLVPVTINSNTTSIYLPHQIRKVGDEAEYIDYEEQKQHRVRKNLLQNTAISKTTATGLTITVNSDKSVIVDGTTNDGKASGVVLGGNTVLGKGTFIISGCPEGGDRETYRLVCVINDGGTQKIAIDSGDGDSVTLTSDDATIINNGFYLAVKSCDNKTFYPMIRKADIEDDTYEPYIADTELDVTLPILPTLSGTNTLSVETTVQPLNVEIKGSIKEVS